MFYLLDSHLNLNLNLNDMEILGTKCFIPKGFVLGTTLS